MRDGEEKAFSSLDSFKLPPLAVLYVVLITAVARVTHCVYARDAHVHAILPAIHSRLRV